MVEKKDYDEFADEQVVNELIEESKEEVIRLNKVIITQNNLIDKLKIFEENNNTIFKELNNKLSKVEKNTKINKANHFLLEIEVNTLKDDLNNVWSGLKK